MICSLIASVNASHTHDSAVSSIGLPVSPSLNAPYDSTHPVEDCLRSFYDPCILLPTCVPSLHDPLASSACIRLLHECVDREKTSSHNAASLGSSLFNRTQDCSNSVRLCPIRSVESVTSLKYCNKFGGTSKNNFRGTSKDCSLSSFLLPLPFLSSAGTGSPGGVCAMTTTGFRTPTGVPGTSHGTNTNEPTGVRAPALLPAFYLTTPSIGLVHRWSSNVCSNFGVPDMFLFSIFLARLLDVCFREISLHSYQLCWLFDFEGQNRSNGSHCVGISVVGSRIRKLELDSSGRNGFADSTSTRISINIFSATPPHLFSFYSVTRFVPPCLN